MLAVQYGKMSESHHPLVVFFCNTFIKILYLAHVVAAVYFPGPHLQVSVMLVYFFFFFFAV